MHLTQSARLKIQLLQSLFYYFVVFLNFILKYFYVKSLVFCGHSNNYLNCFDETSNFIMKAFSILCFRHVLRFTCLLFYSWKCHNVVITKLVPKCFEAATDHLRPLPQNVFKNLL